MLSIIILALIVSAAALIGQWQLLRFGRYVADKSSDKSPEALRAAATFVWAIRPGSGGLSSVLAKLLHRH